MTARPFLIGLAAASVGLLSSPLAPWRHVRVGKTPLVSSGGGGTGFGRVSFGTAPFGGGAGGGAADVLALIAFRSGMHRPVRTKQL